MFREISWIVFDFSRYISRLAKKYLGTLLRIVTNNIFVVVVAFVKWFVISEQAQAYEPGLRPMVKNLTSASPAMKPPMCAAYATPPCWDPPPRMPSPLMS